MIPSILLGLGVAAVTTLIGLAVLVPVLRHNNVLDIPVERSLHDRPVVRGGGIALVGGVFVGLVAAAVHMANTVPANLVVGALVGVLPVLLGLLAFAILGLLDDFYAVPAGARLLTQVGIALVLAGAIVLVYERPIVWVPILVVVWVALVNITNFMDGANGLLGFHALVTASWFAVLTRAPDDRGLTLAASLVLGAVVGFLPVNLSGRVFLGDVGSYALGAAWALLGAALVFAGARPEVVAAPLLVFVADTAYTLQLRLRAGQRWFQPHKLHVYQRLVSAGWSHRAVAVLVAATATVCCALAVPAAIGGGAAVRLACLAGMALVCAVYLRMPVWAGAPSPWRGVP